MKSTRLALLSDDVLLSQTIEVARRMGRNEAALVAHIAEVDRRKLYLGEACSSMFIYCRERLGLSEDMAAKRLQVARASRRFPEMLRRLAAPLGERIHLSGLRILCPHLTEANAGEVLARAAGKTRREIEVLVAELAPRPDAPATLRRLPEQGAKAAAASAVEPAPAAVAAPAPPPASSRPRIEPLSPRRFKLQVTVGEETRDDIEAARDLLRHRIPGGDLAEVVAWAMKLAVKTLRKERYAQTDRPRKKKAVSPEPGSRPIPAADRREVAERDGGRCTFVDQKGRRCTATGMIEFHHEDPHGRGGPPLAENLSLHCRAHNQYQAELDFGAGFMAEKRRRGRRKR